MVWALVGSALIELGVLIVTSFMTTPGNQVGAPFSLGQVSWTLMGTTRGSPMLFVTLPADLLLTAIPLWLAGR